MESVSVQSPKILGQFRGSLFNVTSPQREWTSTSVLRCSTSSPRVAVSTQPDTNGNATISERTMWALWDICANCISKKCNDLPEFDVTHAQLPLQMLLLVIRWLRLRTSWDDTLRICRRHGLNGVGGDNDNRSFLFSFPAFCQTLSAIVGLHVSSGTPQEIDRFLSTCWFSSLELTDLELFLEVCFSENPFVTPAVVFTASVLDVFAVYRHHLATLHSTLQQLNACNVGGLVRLLDMLRSLDDIDQTVGQPLAATSDGLVKSMASSVPKYWKMSGAMDDVHGSDVLPHRLWEYIVLFAMSTTPSHEEQRFSKWNAWKAREATLSLLGESVGSLLLPQSAWLSRIQSGAERCLAQMSIRRLQLQFNFTTKLRQLYIFAAGWGDPNGWTLLTRDQLTKLLTENLLSPRRSAAEFSDWSRNVSSILEQHCGGCSSILPDKAAVRSNKLRERSNSIIVHYSTFVAVLTQLSRVCFGTELSSTLIEGFDNNENAGRHLIASSAGQEARKVVASSIAEEYATEVSRNQAFATRAVFDALVAQHRLIETSSRTTWKKTARHVDAAVQPDLQSPMCGLSPTALLDFAIQGDVIPSMASRGDFGRILRAIFMDYPSTPPQLLQVDAGLFERFTVMVARLPRVQLDFDHAHQVVLQCLSKASKRKK